jgi:hypothetical protein
MAASVRITEKPSLAVEGGREIITAFSVLTNDGIDHVLMASLEGAASASLAALRTAMARLRKSYYRDSSAPWAAERGEQERLWIGLVRSEKDLRRLQVEDDDGLTSFESLEVPPTSPAVIFEDGLSGSGGGEERGSPRGDDREAVAGAVP